MAYLIRQNVDGTVAERWELTDKELVAGRGDQAHARTPDPEMSRQHFKVVPSNQQYVVEDLQSRNGTFVNGQRVTAATTLKPNDLIRAGETNFVFSSEGHVSAMQTLIDVHRPKVLKAQ